MADDPKMTASDRDLLDLSLRSQPDPFLSELVELGQHGTELAVGLLVNGMVMLGRLSRDEALAESLSTLRRRLIDASPKPDGHSDEQWEQVRESFAAAPLQYLADRAQLEQDVLEDLQSRADEEGAVAIDSLPEDLARQVRELGTRAHLTLTDARVAAPGQDGMTAVPVLRVAVAHVTAWWFAVPEADGTANIELWNA